MQTNAQDNEGFTALGLTSDRNEGATTPNHSMWVRPMCWRMRVRSVTEGEGETWALNVF